MQDDPQAGWDHVDGHRTVAMVVSPYTKRREVVSTRFTQAARGVGIPGRVPVVWSLGSSITMKLGILPVFSKPANSLINSLARRRYTGLSIPFPFSLAG